MADTDELLNRIKEKREINSFLEENSEEFIDFDLSKYLNGVLKQKNLKKSDAVAKSMIDRTYCFQIFSGVKKPSRKKLLQLCIGMELSADETQLLLKRTGFSQLYPRSKFDSIVLYALYNRLTVIETNILLEENNLETFD